MHDENIDAENLETELVASEPLMSEMDFDEQDDVPLARLLKKDLFSTDEPTVAYESITSVHFDESSSSEDIFVSTPGLPSTANKEIEQPGHYPLVKSPFHTSSLVDVQQLVPDPNHVGQSTDNVGGKNC
ncbi:envelope-like protein [Cucumis melo var. makuwa]|uniref:Envelope-like protein n=1 Tax=Cucumis melo var. makuwa TaxID=1194695 RepID=A0A5A7UH19_CUCMM|nr:envelope-like protein [Cucumis melo var. makuwa]